MPVPCICAADGSGEHPIELHYEPVEMRHQRPGARIRSLRTPCDVGEAGAADKLGAVTCVGAIDDIKGLLRSRAQRMAAAPPAALEGVLRYAQNKRADRDRHGLDPWDLGDRHPDDDVTWLRAQQRVGRTECLLTPRLQRLWVGPAARDIRMNLRLARPQIQVSYEAPRGQVVFEFEPTGARRRPAGWRIKQGVNVEGVNHTNLETVLDRILPAKILRAAMRLYHQ